MLHPKLLANVSRKHLPGDEEVLTTPDESKAVILNATGAVVATLCDGNRSIDAIATFISDAVAGTDASAVRADVESLVEQLRVAGLLEAS